MSAAKRNPLIQGEHGTSGTKLWFSVFAAVVCVKFALAGVTFGSISFGGFDPTGAATLLGVFGTLYGARRATEAFRPNAKDQAKP